MNLAKTRLLPIAVCLAVASAPLRAQGSPPSFESPQFHALDFAMGGKRLLAVNTPDARLAVFDLREPTQPFLLREIEVGLEPVSVRVRAGTEAWVVCHLGDGILVVDFESGETRGFVRCGDEASDVVFGNGMAFVSCPTDRVVRVVDPISLTVTGEIPIFAQEPRALAVDDNGARIWVASYRSGNGTTIVPSSQAPLQPPPTNGALPAPPRVGLIVRADDPVWSATHGVNLPDWDVFEIDTATRQISRRFAAVGTVLFQLARRPGTDELWVTNTAALNTIRFEPALRGHFVDNRISILDLVGGGVSPVDLNPGISYATLPNPAAKAIALAQPQGICFAPDGTEAFVAASGTDRIGVLDGAGRVVARIELGTGSSGPSTARTMRGPRAIVHHPSARVLFALNRLSNSVSVIDAAARTTLRELALVFDPTPVALREGRGFLHDARLSGNGTNSCGSCHVDSVDDGLAWDLGDPGGSMVTVAGLFGPLNEHPMKGPMVTQTLQGLRHTGPFHWRGDRANLQAFNPTFDALMGGAQLAQADIDAMAAFVDSIVFPSNPHLPLDRRFPDDGSPTSAAAGGRLFNQVGTTAIASCMSCHPARVGTDQEILDGALISQPQPFKTAQLRNLYRKTGRQPVGGQSTRGFGFTHDGSLSRIADFFGSSFFAPIRADADKRLALENFLLHFDTGMAPSVGYGVFLGAATLADPAVLARWQDLELRALLGDCDLVLRGTLAGEAVGMTYDAFFGDYVDGGDFVRSSSQVRSLIQSGTLRGLVMGVPLGQGRRIGTDRDRNGVSDARERALRYGGSTAGCSLELRANSEPKLGNGSFGLVMRGASPSAPGVLLLSAFRAQIPVAGIEILVDPFAGDALSYAADELGIGWLRVPIPSLASFEGVTLRAQAIGLETCGPAGLAATNGLEFTLARW